MRQKRCCIISSHFSTISSQFFAIYISIFHKTEVLTVILRCWTSLNHNWFKSYDTKRKWGDKEMVLSIAVSFRLEYSFLYDPDLTNQKNRFYKLMSFSVKNNLIVRKIWEKKIGIQFWNWLLDSVQIVPFLHFQIKSYFWCLLWTLEFRTLTKKDILKIIDL